MGVRGIAWVVLTLIDILGSIISFVYVPSHNAFDFNLMHVQLCIGIRPELVWHSFSLRKSVSFK